MKYISKLALLLLCLYLFSCKGEYSAEPTFEFKKIPLNQKIKKALNDEYLSQLEFT